MRVVLHGAVLAACLLSTPALASSSGSGSTGRSGKSAGVTCVTCHSGSSTVPTLEIAGPTTLEVGARGQYTVTLRGGPAATSGVNVAASQAGASLEAGAGLGTFGAELAHSAPRAFANGEVAYAFAMVAPNIPGTVTLFASGVSGNGDGAQSGDGSESTTLQVTITAARSGDDGEAEEDGGCTASGGTPALALAALTLRWLRRRRS